MTGTKAEGDFLQRWLRERKDRTGAPDVLAIIERSVSGGKLNANALLEGLLNLAGESGDPPTAGGSADAEAE